MYNNYQFVPKFTSSIYYIYVAKKIPFLLIRLERWAKGNTNQTKIKHYQKEGRQTHMATFPRAVNDLPLKEGF